MFVRVIPNNKGKKMTYFCDLVESFRDENISGRFDRVVVAKSDCFPCQKSGYEGNVQLSDHITQTK